MKSKQLRVQQTIKGSTTPNRRSAKPHADAPIPKAGRVADILGRTPTVPPSSQSVPAKWRWHYRVLLSLQSRLLRERGELRHAAAEPLEPHSMNEADSATDEFDHDLALTQLSADQEALCEVNGALQRIQTGSYGVCEETSKAIPAARLRAIPWARFTCEVEERLEKKGAVHQARLHKPGTVRGEGRTRLAPAEDAEETEEAPHASPNDEKLQVRHSP